MGPREFKLLLHCARSPRDARSIRELVDEGLSWQSLLELAQQHGVRPILRQALKSVCWNAVPQPIQLDLERFHRGNLQKGLFFAGELLRLMQLFRQSRIAAAAFKGPLLADSIYGDLSLREFSDLDLLVHEADLFKVEDILTSCGYRAQFPDRGYRSAFVSYQGQYAFTHEQTGICVDLHWQLSSKSVALPLQIADVWSKLRQVAIAGRMVSTLSDDDLVLFLATHGTKEGWRRLLWICDFAQLLRTSKDIDWGQLLERARRFRTSGPLLLATVLASILLDSPAPAELLHKARNNSAVQAMAEKARRRLLTPAPQKELAEFLNSIATHDSLLHKLWPVISLLTTRTVGDHKAMPLPKPLWGIYYLTRPFRLALKAIGIAVKAGRT
jgi:Uncharacterised nucleotidyltransferase